jgi:hypothetical protein
MEKRLCGAFFCVEGLICSTGEKNLPTGEKNGSTGEKTNSTGVMVSP